MTALQYNKIALALQIGLDSKEQLITSLSLLGHGGTGLMAKAQAERQEILYAIQMLRIAAEDSEKQDAIAMCLMFEEEARQI